MNDEPDRLEATRLELERLQADNELLASRAEWSRWLLVAAAVAVLVIPIWYVESKVGDIARDSQEASQRVTAVQAELRVAVDGVDSAVSDLETGLATLADAEARFVAAERQSTDLASDFAELQNDIRVIERSASASIDIAATAEARAIDAEASLAQLEQDLADSRRSLARGILVGENSYASFPGTPLAVQVREISDGERIDLTVFAIVQGRPEGRTFTVDTSAEALPWVQSFAGYVVALCQLYNADGRVLDTAVFAVGFAADEELCALSTAS